MFPSSGVRIQRQRSVEYLRPPGSTGKNNSCFGDEALLFSALVRTPSPPLFIALQTPGPPPNRLSCQAYSFKRQMQKLCVDVSVWEWICATPRGCKKNPRHSPQLAFESGHSSLDLSCTSFIHDSPTLSEILKLTQTLPRDSQSPELQFSTCSSKHAHCNVKRC